MNVIVSGYYGYGNLGDEAILTALCQQLESVGITKKQIIVLSASPLVTEKTHNVKAINRYDFIKVFHFLKRCDLVISGGGSLFQDVTSWRTIPYYLSIIKGALTFKKPVVVYAQGIGPVNSKRQRYWMAKTLSKLNGITVRDQASANLLTSLGINLCSLQITADPVFGLESFNQESNTKPEILLNLRPYTNWQRDKDDWIDVIKKIEVQTQLATKFIALGPGDLQIAEQLQNSCEHLQVISPKNVDEAIAHMGRALLTVSMRLHGIIFAAVGGGFPIGLNYDPKVEAISNQLATPVLSDFPGENLISIINEKLTDMAYERQELLEKVNLLKKRTDYNRELLQFVLQI